MGNKQWKCRKQEDDAVIAGDENITQRENMATWHRTDIPLTDVYEIMETLGQGHMGEVYKVRRKVEKRGLHNADTRMKSDSIKVVAVPEGLLEMNDNSERSSGSLSFSSKSSNPFKNRRQKKNDKLKNEETLKKAKAAELEEKERQEESANGSLAESPKHLPKSILRNPLEADPEKVEHLAKLSEDKMNMEDDGDIAPLGLAKTDSFEDPAHSIQQKDGNNFHPHFASLIDCFTPSTNDLSHSEEIIIGGDGSGSGSEHDSDELDKDKDKKSRWVPRRKIRFQRLYACKTIGTDQIKEKELQELLNEIYMMRKMDHPYIIRLYEVYQVKRKIWLVMDLCTGGNLTTRKLKEPEVTVVMEQLLRGIAYLHRRGICHRDLKMENILYEDGSPNSPIRLIDFGLSQTFNKSDSKQKAAAYCLSPEIAGQTGQYTEKSDVWSIGVIAWILLAGDYPFLKTLEDMKDEKRMKALIDADFSFGITWRGRGITSDAKSFVSGCFKKDPKDRWSAIEALEFLQDQWIPKLEEKGALEVEMEEKRIAALPPKKDPKKRPNADIKIKDPSAILGNSLSSKIRKDHDIFDRDIMADIMRFAEYGSLKKTALIALANTMDRKDVGILSELFLMVDTEQTGTISPAELKDAFKKVDMPSLDEERMEKIFAGIDHDMSGQIHFVEFVAALAEGADLVTMDRISDAFDRMDSEGKGYISHDDIKNILGKNYSKEVAEKMIEEGDFKKNGRIDYDEFVTLMLKDNIPEFGTEEDSMLSLSERSIDDHS